MPKPTSKNIAVVGGGYWGKNLIRNFSELGSLKIVCDTNAERLSEIAQNYLGINVSGDYDAVLNDDTIDGVVIATPAVSHYDMTRKALKAGKDVLVEKPLALTVAEGEELIELARNTKRIIMVGHILEYHPAVQKLVSMVSAGELGKINYIYSNRLNMGKIRTEENILWSFAPHDISVIIRLLGEMPSSVSAFGDAYLNKDIADVTLTNLFFDSGVKAHIFVSWLHPFKEQKLVVVGTEKMAVFDDLSENKLVLYCHRVNWVDHSPVVAKGEAMPIEIENLEPLKQECLHFLECINKRKEPLTGGRNALDVLKVLASSQRSLEANGSRVDLDALNESKENEVFIHPTAIVDPGAVIGAKSRIWHFTHIMPEVQIGKKCNIGQNVFIANNVVIGNNVKIQNNVSVYEGVILEDDVFCGPSCVFTNIKTPRCGYPRNTADDYTKTLVKKGASIGANATIVCGITIGEHALIGAGAVVTKVVPAHGVVYGNPAKVKGWVCACGDVLVDKKARQLFCNRCKTDLDL